MTTERAFEVLKKYTTKPNLLKHALAVSATMRHFAHLENEDENYWAVIGMLHDIDFEMYPNEHCFKCVEILKNEGFDDKVIYAVQSHGYEICTDVEPVLYMEKVLSAIDQLTGLIIACALIRPEKKLEVVDTESVMKKWNKKDFAAGTNRERIVRCCTSMNKDLDYMIGQTLIAMKSISTELGL